MRIDKFLKVARVIKRRTVANEAADNGRISVNGKIVKPSYEVKIGDVVEIKFGDKISKFEILQIPKVVGKDLTEIIKLLWFGNKPLIYEYIINRWFFYDIYFKKTWQKVQTGEFGQRKTGIWKAPNCSLDKEKLQFVQRKTHKLKNW